MGIGAWTGGGGGFVGRGQYNVMFLGRVLLLDRVVMVEVFLVRFAVVLLFGGRPLFLFTTGGVAATMLWFSCDQRKCIISFGLAVSQRHGCFGQAQNKSVSAHSIFCIFTGLFDKPAYILTIKALISPKG